MKDPEMSERSPGPSYRDPLAAAHARIQQLERRTRELEAALQQPTDAALAARVRELETTLRRWDRLRGGLSLLLGLTGLLALRLADHWGMGAALLALCAVTLTVGIVLVWPRRRHRGPAATPPALPAAHEGRPEPAAGPGEKGAVRIAVDEATPGEEVELAVPPRATREEPPR